MSELSMHELEAEHGEVLPEREALAHVFNIGSFNGGNHINTITSSKAVSFGGFDNSTLSEASSSVTIY
jgi:hypothetical protein